MDKALTEGTDFLNNVLCLIMFYFNWSLTGDHLQPIQYDLPFPPQLCGKLI